MTSTEPRFPDGDPVHRTGARPIGRSRTEAGHADADQHESRRRIP
ncbi:hypothetical protein [Nocardia beijingensis]|uniref:Uncharacterized protein n=1 Tax=Nocardia beijingensis TaxID=95162 RepID=A0ABW7WLZ3_9NOCA